MAEEEPKDESYWKDPEQVAADKLVEAYRRSLKGIQLQPLSPDGYCACCLDPKNRVARKLNVIGLLNRTGKRESPVPVVACSVCDAELLQNARGQAS